MKESYLIRTHIVDLMRSFPNSWTQYTLNDLCATFVGRKSGKTHATKSLGELMELLKEEQV